MNENIGFSFKVPALILNNAFNLYEEEFKVASPQPLILNSAVNLYCYTLDSSSANTVILNLK